ncbi:MAG: hypothetical protein HQK53_04265 [Oligoflexia bacterium]|nr:hypothetical protein [Oligoflexia bacterium]
MRLLLGIIIAITTAFAFSAWAGKCVITENRTACKGQEATCFEKCAGKLSCDITKVVGAEESCKKEAIKNCTVFRPGITKIKKMTAKFDDKAVTDGTPAKSEFS